VRAGSDRAPRRSKALTCHLRNSAVRAAAVDRQSLRVLSVLTIVYRGATAVGGPNSKVALAGCSGVHIIVAAKAQTKINGLAHVRD
jgi:hypothetical protein